MRKVFDMTRMEFMDMVEKMAQTHIDGLSITGKYNMSQLDDAYLDYKAGMLDAYRILVENEASHLTLVKKIQEPKGKVLLFKKRNKEPDND